MSTPAVLALSALLLTLVSSVTAIVLYRRSAGGRRSPLAPPPPPAPQAFMPPPPMDDGEEIEALMRAVRAGDPRSRFERFPAEEWTTGVFAQQARSRSVPSARPIPVRPRRLPERTGRHAVDSETAIMPAYQAAASSDSAPTDSGSCAPSPAGGGE